MYVGEEFSLFVDDSGYIGLIETAFDTSRAPGRRHDRKFHYGSRL